MNGGVPPWDDVATSDADGDAGDVSHPHLEGCMLRPPLLAQLLPPGVEGGECGGDGLLELLDTRQERRRLAPLAYERRLQCHHTA